MLLAGRLELSDLERQSYLASFLTSFFASTSKKAAISVMGGGASRREPEVHVVVVQSQENGKMDAKLLRQTFVRTGEAEKGQESIEGT